VAYSSDGVLATAGEDGRVGIGPIPPQPVGAGWVEVLAWAPGPGARLATAVGRRVQLWTPDGVLVAESADLPATVECLAWAPDGSRMAAGGHGGVTLLDAGLDASRFIDWVGVVLAVAWAPDGRRLACGMQDCAVWCWDVDALEATPLTGLARKVRELAWSPDGRWLVLGGGTAATAWAVEASEQLELRGHERAVVWAGFQPGGPLLATAAEDGVVILWQLPGAEPLAGATVGEPASACAWSPDGTRIALAGETGRVAVFRLA
jgi:WD40 repeat protein